MEHNIAHPASPETDHIIQSTAKFARDSGCEVDILLPRQAGRVAAAQEAADESEVRLDVTLTATYIKLRFSPSNEPALRAGGSGEHSPSQVVAQHGAAFARRVGPVSRWLIGTPTVSDTDGKHRLSAADLSAAVLLVAILANVRCGLARLDRYAGALYLVPVPDNGEQPPWPEGSWEAIIACHLAEQQRPVPIGTQVRRLVPACHEPWRFVIERARDGVEVLAETNESLSSWARELLADYRTHQPQEWDLLQQQLSDALDTQRR